MTKDVIKGNFEFAYPHGDGLLVLGWCSVLEDQHDQVSIVLGIGEHEERIALSDCVRYFRPDVASSLKEDTKPKNAHYGFVASFVLSEALSSDDFVGLSLCLNAETEDEDILEMSILSPEHSAAEAMMRENWQTLFKAVADASYSLEMYRSFENLVTRFGKVEDLDAKSAVNPIRMAVDVCARVSDTAMLVCGWVFSFHANEPILDLTITDEYGLLDEVGFLDKAMRLSRADVVDGFQLKGPRNQPLGFLCFIEGLSLDTHQVRITAKTEAQRLSELREVLELSANPIALSEYLFTLFPLQSDNLRSLLDKHVGPAIKTAWQTYHEVTKLNPSDIHVEDLGIAPKNPDLSLIIPLYKRYDFVEYQLSQFALDPYMKDVEIIYVNDDPEIQAALLAYCMANQPIYDIPFKVVHAGKNLGYAGANNLGASLASAEVLLFLNSDVMPKETGWLPKMLAAYRSKPDIGALGVRLLYEDESIQHDGISFVQYPYFQGMWICEHPAKGLSRSIRPATFTEVEAVTGACLMVSKALYDEVGGLDEDYILGDFEDSDLCLKLFQKGYKSYVQSEIELYHLERQSQSLFSNNDWKAKLTAYNCWQHNERWHDVIMELKGVKVHG